MKKTMKKILSFALAMVMCASLAIPAFATEPTCPGVNEDHFKTNCTYTYVDTYAPKCGERGYTVYQCNGCNKYFADDFTENTEQHDYQQTKAPTCTELGTEKCTKCGDERDVAALGHDWTPSANVCGQDGAELKEITQTCSRCDATQTVPTTKDHTWTIEVKEEPICGKDGLAIYTCTVCGFVKEVAIDCETAEVGGHKWVFVEAVAKTCTTAGNTAGYVCDNEGCDAVAEVGMVIDTVDKDGNPVQVTVESKYQVVPASHEYSSAYVGPTCVTPGYTMYVCTVEGCGSAYMEMDVDAPALGHTMPDNATTTTTPCAIVDGNFVPGKTVKTGTCKVCSMNATVTETVTHTYTATPVAATCQTGAYTIYTCNMGCPAVESAKGEPVADAHNFVYIYTGSDDAVNYPSLDLAGTYAPTCTETGYGYKVCANAGCDADMELIVVPALGHDYGDHPVYNCLTGMLDYTCATCSDVKSEAIEGFNKNDYTKHYDWIEDGVWDGAINVNVDNGCGKSAIYNYTCDHCDQVILVIVATSHTAPDGWVNNAKAPTCTQDGNYAWFICDDCNTYCYYDATDALVEIANVENTNAPELVENSDMPKAVVLEKTGCDIVIDKVYVAPVCGAPGQTAQWHCKNANCDAACTYNAENVAVDADGYPMVKAGDEKYLTGTSAVSVPLTVNHNFVYTDNATHIFQGAATVQNRTCSQYGYHLYACTNCNAWEWRGYAQATGHNIVETKPECTVNGYKVCENAWCEYNNVNKLTPANPTYEVVYSVGHTDENGNPIICVADDFWCAVCNPEFIENPNFDQNAEESETNPKMIPSGLNKLKFWESHNTAREDWRAVQAQHSYPDRGGMIPTALTSIKDCTQWRYLLYVCPDCEDDTIGGHFNDEVPPCTEHHVYDVVTDKNYVAADADKIPDRLYTVVIKPATFAEAGILGVPCSCGGCEQIVATKPYINDEIGFDLVVDSAIVAGADIVDSGRIEIDVLVNAYDIDVYSIYFDLAYNANHLEFVEAKLPESSPFGISGLDANATVGEVHVYLANYGEQLSNIDFDLFGEQMAIVTLVFDVKNVNATGTGKTASGVALNDIRVHEANGSVVDVAAEAVAPATFNKLLNSNLTEGFDIYMLGNVTKGVVENQNQTARIDDFDALNWEALFIEGKYLAAADINKNGELDAYDYQYICDYIVQTIDYNELCAK
ncbi:MAG: hypothetical protein IJD74_01425 [Clostridia bacterium]|nr:hypothetical protein [Clostridia bacterium]